VKGEGIKKKDSEKSTLIWIDLEGMNEREKR
jgi:hypothetical protein